MALMTQLRKYWRIWEALEHYKYLGNLQVGLSHVNARAVGHAPTPDPLRGHLPFALEPMDLRAGCT